MSLRNVEPRGRQGTSGVEPELEDKGCLVPSWSQLIKSQTQVSRAPSCLLPAASPCLQRLGLMNVLLHKAARYVLSLFQLFICLLGCRFPCSFPLVSATLL